MQTDQATREAEVKQMQQMLYEQSPYLVTAYDAIGEAVPQRPLRLLRAAAEPGRRVARAVRRRQLHPYQARVRGRRLRLGHRGRAAQAGRRRVEGSSVQLDRRRVHDRWRRGDRRRPGRARCAGDAPASAPSETANEPSPQPTRPWPRPRPRPARVEAEDGQPRRRGYASYVGFKVLGLDRQLVRSCCVVNFFLFRVLPGDPARTLGRGRLSTPAQVEAFNKPYGLDRAARTAVPDLPEEHVHRSPRHTPSQYHEPVSTLILHALWPTLLLVGLVDGLGHAHRRVRSGSAARGSGAGCSTGSRPGTSLTLYSMPEWWLGLLLIAVFACRLLVRPRPVPHRRPAHARTSIPTRCTASWTRPGTSCCR